MTKSAITSKAVRTLEFYGDAPDGEIGEKVEIIAAQEGNHYILEVRVDGSTVFQIDTSIEGPRRTAREAAKLINFACDEGYRHGIEVAIETRRVGSQASTDDRSSDFKVEAVGGGCYVGNECELVADHDPS